MAASEPVFFYLYFMEAGDEIINRVASSALKVFDLEEIHVSGERVLLDIREQLYQGMILKEKPFPLPMNLPKRCTLQR